MPMVIHSAIAKLLHQGEKDVPTAWSTEKFPSTVPTKATPFDFVLPRQSWEKGPHKGVMHVSSLCKNPPPPAKTVQLLHKSLHHKNRSLLYLTEESSISVIEKQVSTIITKATRVMRAPRADIRKFEVRYIKLVDRIMTVTTEAFETKSPFPFLVENRCKKWPPNCLHVPNHHVLSTLWHLQELARQLTSAEIQICRAQSLRTKFAEEKDRKSSPAGSLLFSGRARRSRDSLMVSYRVTGVAFSRDGGALPLRWLSILVQFCGVVSFLPRTILCIRHHFPTLQMNQPHQRSYLRCAQTCTSLCRLFWRTRRSQWPARPEAQWAKSSIHSSLLRKR